MFNQSRRTFIKGAAYSSALAMGGLSSVAMAADALATKTPTVGTELVTLINHTASSVTFNSISGVGLTDIYQYLATKMNKLEKHTGQNVVTMAPGEQLSFVVAAMSSGDSVNANTKNLFITDVLDGHLAISRDYPEFNGIFPITVFENRAA